MPGLVPGIHVLLVETNASVDGRDKPGHDAETIGTMTSLRSLFASSRIVVAPGCYDALTALMIEQATAHCPVPAYASTAARRPLRALCPISPLTRSAFCILVFVGHRVWHVAA